jgi:hypothetical protein
VLLRLVALCLSAAVSANTFAQDLVPPRQAEKAGVKQCLAQIRELSQFVLKEHRHASHDIWSNSTPNDRPFFSFVVKGYSDGDSHVSIMVGPDKTGRCSGEWRETAYWTKSCTVVREEIFGKLKFTGNLNNSTIALQNSDDTLSVYLTPQSNGVGCLSTRREVIFYP